MSTAEPVSAFGAFRKAKEISEAKKKNKKSGKHDAKATNGSSKGKPAVKKVQTKSKKQKISPKKTNKTASQGNTQPVASKNRPKKFKDSEVIGLVEQLMGDPSKKLSKSQIKKKQELEGYLVEQLEKDERNDSLDGEEDDFDSASDEGEEEEIEYTDSFENAAEYTINESGHFSHEEEPSDNEKDRSGPASSNIKKRKNVETEKATALNGSEATLVKKLKTTNDLKSTKKSENNNHSEKSEGAKTSSATAISVKLEPLSPPHNIAKVSSIEEGKRAFKWLINPVQVEDFFSKYWENKACLIKRKQSSYFSHLISFEAIDQMLIRDHVEFTKNIDVTSYKNGVRETLNPEGRAMPPVVWDHYGQGCSIRLLNPQTFLPNLFTLSATMQEYFHCLVGANAYLTPPNSQGFAPHYDDIEAFVLQIEGRKRWKLYKPRNASEVLPRFSSANFKQEEIGKPILEAVLEPGDVLYFPRGTIHQACTEPGYHSLHITLSVYQKQSFADLVEKMMPLMLQKAVASNVELRRGLPMNIWQNAGITYSENSSKERSELLQKVTKLVTKCIKEMPLMEIVDAAVDQCAKKFQHEALPPHILPAEKLRTVFGSRSRTNERGECLCDYDIDERTNVRLLRANILRLVEEEEKLRIYYYLDNSKEYCEYEPNFIEIEPMEAASVEVLIKSYPTYVGVSQLPLSTDEQKINFATALWERGLLMMEKPFK